MYRVAKRTRRDDKRLHAELRKRARAAKASAEAIAAGAGVEVAEAERLLSFDEAPKVATLTKAAAWLKVETADFINESPKFHVFFRDHLGLEQRLPATSDKRTSGEYARQLEQLVNVRKTRSEVPPALLAWAENLPPDDVKRLVAAGLIEGSMLCASAPIGEHVKAWLESIRRNGRTEKHIEECGRRINQILEDSGVKHWAAMTVERVTTAIDRAATKGDRPLSTQNRNKYIATVKQFGRFMVEADRAQFNPFTRLKKSREKKQRRRALSGEEIPWLLNAARSGPTLKVRGWEGTAADRLIAYLVELNSGLRASALAGLRVRDFKLDDRIPHIHVPAHLEKNRTENRVPLRPDMVAELRTYFKMKTPTALAFNVPPGQAAWMVRQDLAAAKAAYVKAGKTPKERDARASDSFLAEKVEGYMPFDFHSLRVTAGTRFQEEGVPVGFVQRILNHKTLAMTLDNYNQPGLDTLARMVSNAPALATGA